MKIQQLNLSAFGPFTDHELFFGEEGTGLHIVYGPNEAGKSSALRGLKALLYGIEARTQDNFQHDNKRLRISGHLLDSNGHELTFTRRKGNKNTLLSLQGDKLDDAVLAPFLQGVTEELFETLFGIDHQALVQGGQEILEQKGEVGQTLFSAALGSHVLHTVLEQLDDQAEELFKSRGSKPAINASLSDHKKLKKAIKEQSLSSREWETHRRALDETIRQLEQVQAELGEHRKSMSRLQRIRRILPKVATRRDLQLALESMGDVLILADDFSARRRDVQQKLETAKAMAGQAKPRHTSLQQQLSNLSVDQQLLEQSEVIEELHTRLGSHRKALLDRPHLVGEKEQLLSEASSLLKEIRPDLNLAEVEKLRPVVARSQHILDLGNERPLLTSSIENAQSSQRKIEQQLNIARKELQELPDTGAPDGLNSTIVAARKQGDLDGMIQADQKALSRAQAQYAAGYSRLSLWQGEPEELPGLAVPNRESINRFELAYDTLDRNIQRLLEKQEENADELRETSLRLEEHQRTGNVPTEADLASARTGRDHIWQLLRRQWLDKEDIAEEERELHIDLPLPDSYEDRVISSDELSDRLRREGDRVFETASLQLKQESIQQQSGETAAKLEQVRADRQQTDTDWRALWMGCGIQPRSPKEMRVWLDDLEKLRERFEQVAELKQKVAEQIQQRDLHIQRLKQQLEALGKPTSGADTMEMVLLECEHLKSQLDESRQQRRQLENEIVSLEARVQTVIEDYQQAEDKYHRWKGQWHDLLERFGLQADITPREMSGFINKLRDLFEQQKAAEDHGMRIKGIDRDAEQFTSQVEKLLQSTEVTLADHSVENAVRRLNALLSENRSTSKQQEQLQKQIHDADAELQSAEATIDASKALLNELCAEAQVEDVAALDEAESNSAECLKSRKMLEAVEQEILQAGEGASISDLEAETQGIDPDELPGQIEALDYKINNELEPGRTELAQTRGREEKELELMDGNDDAAELADRAQAVLAGIRANAEQYVRVKLAARVLRDEIERYRKENQGPLIKRASEHFSALTLGSFERLMADFDEKDEPVLVGIRPDGERVYVAGMSAGTRDQLYLALRLASLEKYMQDAQPMPFIVDDILVDFDDQRSQAALNELAILAGKTQVILFTHHSQVVEQAKNLQGTAFVKVHVL